MTTAVEVLSLNVSQEKGTVKHPVPQVAVDDLGIVGDAHAGRWHRQVSLLAQESIDRFSLRVRPADRPGGVRREHHLSWRAFTRTSRPWIG